MHADPSVCSSNTDATCESNSVPQLHEALQFPKITMSDRNSSIGSNDLHAEPSVDSLNTDASGNNSFKQLQELNTRAHRADAQRNIRADVQRVLFGTAKASQSDNTLDAHFTCYTKCVHQLLRLSVRAHQENGLMERGEDDSEGDPEDDPGLGRSPPCSVYHAPRRTGVPMRYPPSGLYLR